MDLQALAAQFALLAGFAALVAVVVNAGKQSGIVKDGQAPVYVLVLNVIGFVIFVAVHLFAPQVDVGAADSAIGQLAQILVLVLGLVGQLGVSKVSNLAVRGLPVIGFSYAYQAALRPGAVPLVD